MADKTMKEKMTRAFKTYAVMQSNPFGLQRPFIYRRDDAKAKITKLATFDSDAEALRVCDLWNANAALTAMREPSEAMVEDGGYVLDDDVEGAGVVACKTFRKAWQAAIDTARNEEPSDPKSTQTDSNSEKSGAPAGT